MNLSKSATADRNTIKGNTQRASGPHMGPGPGPHGHRGPYSFSGEHADDAKKTLSRLWHYLDRHWLGLVLSFVLITLSTVFNLLGPYLMGRGIDDYISKHQIMGLLRIAILMLCVYGLTSLTVLAQSCLMVKIGQKVIQEIRDELFGKLQRLPLKFFDVHTHGELMSRLTNDVDNISMTLSNSLTQLFSGILMISGVSVMMFFLSWRLALVTILIIPVMFTLTRIVSIHTRKGFREQQKLLGSLNGMIEENVTGERVIQAYNRQEKTIVEFEDLNTRFRYAATKAQTYAGVLGPLTNMVNNLGNAVIVGSGGWMALNGWVTVGTIAAFINYAQQFGRPLNEMANLFNTIQSALAGAERIFQIMDEPPEEEESGKSILPDKLEGDIVFQDVHYSYVKGSPIINGISFHAEPGETLALIGPTGAGKTTIISLLMRFYNIDSGSILIDGIDITKWDRKILRQKIGMVLQDTSLFSLSVMENIRYGRLDATDEEVIRAARMANADEFIRHLPKGYKTQLSERGANLSQGQRQLLTIARAILANPSILILDEATSNVDTRTETSVQDALLRFMKGRTCLVIAHRLKTIRNADRILAIVDGKILEEGSHLELLAKKGFYYRMCETQMGKEYVE